MFYVDSKLYAIFPSDSNDEHTYHVHFQSTIHTLNQTPVFIVVFLVTVGMTATDIDGLN